MATTVLHGQDDRRSTSFMMLAVGVLTGGCALLFLGAFGWNDAQSLPEFARLEAAQYWPVGVHLLITAGFLLAGAWLKALLYRLPQPGLVPIALFGVVQFGLLAIALINIALAAGAVAFRGGPFPIGLLFAIPGFAALTLHSELYMQVLRLRSWVHAVSQSPHEPVKGGLLVLFTLLSNLLPLALFFQTLMIQFGVLVATLYRRTMIEPQGYAHELWLQASTFTAQEIQSAVAVVVGSLALAIVWSIARGVGLGRLRAADVLADALTPQQAQFLEAAEAASVTALARKSSAQRYVVWSFVWFCVVTPLVMYGAYIAYTSYDVWREAFALSRTGPGTSDFEAFATLAPGIGKYLAVIAAVFVVLFFNGAAADQIFSGARFDRLAYGRAFAQQIRVALLRGISVGDIGPGRSFDADTFVTEAARTKALSSTLLALLVPLVCVGVVVWEFGRNTVFTSDGLMISDSALSPPVLVPYDKIQAASLSCAQTSLGPRPSYELSLPDGRVVDMIGTAALDTRLDQYLTVDRRIRFSGVGFAFPPSDGEACLKAIQQKYNSVIAAGTGRLLQLVD